MNPTLKKFLWLVGAAIVGVIVAAKVRATSLGAKLPSL